MTSGLLTMADLLAMEDAPEPRTTHTLTPEAQGENLLSAYRRYNEAAEPLVPGTLCREKQGMGFFKVQPTIFMFIRTLDPQCFYDQLLMRQFIGNVMENYLDCLVTSISDEARILCCPHDSRTLERVTEAELRTLSKTKSPSPRKRKTK